ncbi:hypothetical protein Clacol_009612 [Clathrus columnatus]|uniref:non-specific serine/threonine protein kinase n=1 Tax=Clathrus columnatus TaxID=1419009 RepID=A0AAV5ASL2_9AGAM|nr:hypothetical protein Clacol_009612 [Clathrus columnatus]
MPPNLLAPLPLPTPDPELSSGSRFDIAVGPFECSDMYRPGGYHPVEYGDRFHEDRYKVIRKLGCGSFSTVWLAVDSRTNRYVALKIMTAKNSITDGELEINQYLLRQSENDPRSDYITILLDAFVIEGPNGKHRCLVFEPTGPSAQWMGKYEFTNYPPLMAKKIFSDVLHGLAFLHENNIVHGDIQPRNFLFLIRDITNVEEDKLKQDETMVDTVAKLFRFDRKIDKWAPKHIYQDMPLRSYALADEQNTKVKLSDLGFAFWTNNPPSTRDSPIALRAPELILGKPFGPPIDIWALGCLLFEFLAGKPLFLVLPNFWGTKKNKNSTDDDHLIQLHDIIGKLPNDIMEAWPRAKEIFDPVTHQPREKFRIHEYLYDPLEVMFAKVPFKYGIDDAESAVICSLIRQMLVYSPADRPSATELLKHPWFLI